jgi:hypothetical protein
LYNGSGPIEVWIGDDSNKPQQDPGIIWVVKYYDVSCPHCWYFSAVYPLVAKALASPSVRFAAINCLDTANALACQKASVTKYPTLLVYNAKPGLAPHVVHIHSSDDSEDPLPAKDIADWLVKFSAGKIQITHPEALDAGPQFKGNKLVRVDGAPGKPGWTHEGYGSVQARFHDAHIGLGRLLMDGYVNKGKYQAALEVVAYIGRCFAKDEKELFDKLLTQLKSKQDLEPLEFKAIIKAWMQPFGESWLFCKTKTCAVWQLFHCLTATIAIGYSNVTVTEALPKFRFMVDNFLDCEACRNHFVQAYDNCLFGRCTVQANDTQPQQAKALVLWLWRTHNAVNVRVLKENPALSQGGSVDRRWPVFRDCAGCWDQNVVSGGVGKELTFTGQRTHDQPVYDVFESDVVYKFIKLTYLGISADDDTRLFEKLPNPFLAGRVANDAGFTSTVLSCAAAGLVLTLLILAVRRQRDRRDTQVVHVGDGSKLCDCESFAAE